MSEWTSVSALDVIIEGGRDRCNIFANGLNRIRVVVSIQPIDDKAEPVYVDPNTLWANTWLVDFVNAKRLSWNGSSGWCYTDQRNEFTQIPTHGPSAEVQADEKGVQQVEFYVYCSPDQNLRSIGVEVKPSSGDAVKSWRYGDFDKKIEVDPLERVIYKLADISWVGEDAITHAGDKSWVKNFYLSCARSGFHFTKFSVSAYCSKPGHEGLIGWNIGGEKNFRGVYVWYQEPHVKAQKTIINFPGDWSNKVTVYNKTNPDRILGFTWAQNMHGGSGKWKLPNGCMTSSRQWYSTKVTAYDQYGNSGDFWPDTKYITDPIIDLDDQPLSLHRSEHGDREDPLEPTSAEQDPSPDIAPQQSGHRPLDTGSQH